MNDSDLQIEACSDAIMRGGTKRGGQSVGVDPKGVLITHVPTGIMAYSAQHRAQWRNKAAAVAMIRAGLQYVEEPT